MKSRNLIILFLSSILTIGLTFAGCSNKKDLLREVSGQWQDSQNKDAVEIHLEGDAKSLTVKGQTYPVTVESVEMSNYVVSLKVQNGSAKPELWTIRQMWDESGDSFKLAFNHSGEKEVLIPKNQS